MNLTTRIGRDTSKTLKFPVPAISYQDRDFLECRLEEGKLFQFIEDDDVLDGRWQRLQVELLMIHLVRSHEQNSQVEGCCFDELFTVLLRSRRVHQIAASILVFKDRG